MLPIIIVSWRVINCIAGFVLKIVEIELAEASVLSFWNWSSMENLRQDQVWFEFGSFIEAIE